MRPIEEREKINMVISLNSPSTTTYAHQAINYLVVLKVKALLKIPTLMAPHCTTKSKLPNMQYVIGTRFWERGQSVTGSDLRHRILWHFRKNDIFFKNRSRD